MDVATVEVEATGPEPHLGQGPDPKRAPSALRTIGLGCAIGATVGLLATFTTYIHVLALSRAHEAGLSFLGAFITAEERVAYYGGASVLVVAAMAVGWRWVVAIVRRPPRRRQLPVIVAVALCAGMLTWSLALHTTYLAVETVTNGPFDDGPEMEL